jgi:hypothetical protein
VDTVSPRCEALAEVNSLVANRRCGVAIWIIGKADSEFQIFRNRGLEIGDVKKMQMGSCLVARVQWR